MTKTRRTRCALPHERRELVLRPWLFRIAHNEAISILGRRRATTELDETTGAGRDMDALMAEREDARRPISSSRHTGPAQAPPASTGAASKPARRQADAAPDRPAPFGQRAGAAHRRR